MGLGKLLDSRRAFFVVDSALSGSLSDCSGIVDIIKETDSSTLGITYLLGLLWGIGGLPTDWVSGTSALLWEAASY
jgi:hypothetical protein